MGKTPTGTTANLKNVFIPAKSRPFKASVSSGWARLLQLLQTVVLHQGRGGGWVQ